jgi:hypothetical protein
MGSDIPAISDCEQVANTQQEIGSSVLLLQMHAMSARLQVPRPLPKHACCVLFSHYSLVVVVNYLQHISGSNQEDSEQELWS